MRGWAILGAIALVVAPGTVAAQRRAPAKPVVAGGLSRQDIVQAAALFGLKFANGKLVDECDLEAGGPDLKDLNGDGRAEAIFFDGMCLGGNAGFVGIAARKADGGWKVIFADRGILDILKTRRAGWPDLRIGKPGMEAPPVYHWIGSRYDYVTGDPDDTPVATGPIGKRTGAPSTASAMPPAPVIAPTPVVSYTDASLSLCTNTSGENCDFVVGPAFTTYLDPACQYGKFPIPTCADAAIRLAEAKSMSGVYLIYFDHGKPSAIGGGVLPLDRFYRAVYLEKNRKGEWRSKGQSALAGLLRCPDYGLSSLHMRRVTGVPQETSVARFVRCDVVNRGEYTYRDPALVGDPPFLRPGTAVPDLQASGAPQPDAPLAAGEATASVWALGRVRILVERGARCGPEENLGKGFCFGEAIDWLRRRPGKTEVDVIAMNDAYVPGSMVPYDNGRGWQVYRVARAGDAFLADAQRHFATRVQVPQGCIYQGVRQDAWYITVARGRRVAVEAKLYGCAAWHGPSLYAGNADYSFVDMAGLDYTGTAQDYRDRSQAAVGQAPVSRGDGIDDRYNNPTLRALIARRQADMAGMAAQNEAFDRMVGTASKAPVCAANEASAGLALINGGPATTVCEPTPKPSGRRPRRSPH